MTSNLRLTIALACIVALIGGAAYYDSQSNPTVPFDPGEWRRSETSREERPTVRQRMLADLLGRHPLVGLTRDSIEQMLGPRLTDKFATYPLAYWLGPEPSYLPIDSEWLIIAFDSAGRASHYQIVTD